MVSGYKRSLYIRRWLAYKKLGMLEKAQEDFKMAEVPEWFDTIIPALRKGIFEALKEGVSIRFADPSDENMGIELVGVIMSEKKSNGIVIFDYGVLAERAFDAKTGELVWMS